MFTPSSSSATPASTVAGAAPRPTSPSDSLSNGVGEGRGEVYAPWQRVDAAWPVIPNSPTGLDGDAQKLVRHLLTKAAGQRFSRRRWLEAARLWIWEPAPHLAEYVRQRRFYAAGLHQFPPPDLYPMLRTEARLGLEVVATPPGVLGVEVWQELLELQCQRIGQVYVELQRQLGAARARAELEHILEALI